MLPPSFFAPFALSLRQASLPENSWYFCLSSRRCSRASSHPPESLQSGENALAASRTLFPCTSYYLYPLLPPFRRCLPSVKRFFSSRRDTHARTVPEYIRSGGKQECWDGISVRLDLIRYYTAGSPSFAYIGSRGVPLAASQRRLHPILYVNLLPGQPGKQRHP